MSLSDSRLYDLANAIASRNTRTAIEEHLVRGGFYHKETLTGEHSEFRKFLIKKEFVLAVIEDLRDRDRLFDFATYMNEESALPDGLYAELYPAEELPDPTPPKTARSEKPRVSKRGRLRLPKADWKVLLPLLALLVSAFVCLYGNNLCQQSAPPPWTKGALQLLCPAGSAAREHIAITPSSSPAFTPSPDPCASPGSDWACDCISSVQWSAYSYPGPQKLVTPCLALGEWGLAASDGELLITAVAPQPWPEGVSGIRRGIFTLLPSNTATVEATIVVEDLFTPQANDLANLAIGVIPSNPPRPEAGILLIYQLESPSLPIQLKTRERGSTADYLPQGYTLGETHSLSIRITLVDAAIYVDGNLLVGPTALPDEPALWIGYLLPDGGRIRAKVRDLDVRGE